MIAVCHAAADPAIARIVADECSKRGVPYSHYATLPQIISRFTACAPPADVAAQTRTRFSTC